MSRLANLSVRNGLQWRGQNKIRMLSTSAPYLLLDRNVVGKASSGEKAINCKLYDPRKGETVKSPALELTKELQMVGSSRGWVALMNESDSTVRLTDMFRPGSSAKVISMPPLIQPEERRDLIINVSLSSPPEKEEDCVVAVKFLGPYLSLCRPGDSEWTHIKAPWELKMSSVMYSDRDRVFYLNTLPSGGSGLAESGSPLVKYHQRLPCHGSPGVPKPDLDKFTLHMVESPCGELFIIWWFLGDKSEGYKTKRLMVFREDKDQGKGYYTEDIGDLCIFLGPRTDHFCVRASTYPGLVPNSIYFAGFHHSGVYDLATRSIRLHDHITSHPRLALWLAPLQSCVQI
ncbi:PREDICTED: uncharacterized protein LOC104806512 [Tarenaya hassleriana]|uniref:uncharacterized protein LOC104806512 n=1 Tax=Tarenaya hassleriana TaxID=28532 RepID=UPI00053C0CA6|nr:PREDICTED: uncharacterized protein LOC104806512 [Tarenaya hassleriana]XP_010529756.1 PREDICTED: uncharacterized protein LOC104806512 [Tarenaya hassleriana]